MTRHASILLIDDDLMVRQALGQVLTMENYDVVAAANRQEALRELGKHRIDFVLLDLHPRHEDGWETVQRLNALQPHVPVIAMTARIERTEANTHTPAVVLEKPLNLSVLLKTLNQLSSQTPEFRQQPGHRSPGFASERPSSAYESPNPPTD